MKNMTLTTSINGRRAVIHRAPTGFGPVLWAGEFLTREGRHYAHRRTHLDHLDVRVANDLGTLLSVLAAQAPDLVLRGAGSSTRYAYTEPA